MIHGKNIIKDFGKTPTRVIHDISIEIDDGEFLAISGRSGSGKSTLLYLLSTLDQATTGELYYDDRNINEFSVAQIHEFRNTKIGFVFQFHYLLPELTAIENVLLPTRKMHLQEEKKGYAMSLFEKFDIADEIHKFPSQLSGGQQQRVAIIRALIMKPKYLFADEPTGNLDSVNAAIVMDILKNINQEEKTTLVLVTHEPEFAAMAQREIFLIDGRIDSIRGEKPQQ